MAGWPDGVEKVVLTSIDSTSAEAARRAPHAATWFLGLAQTAARGRRGRPWAMPAGNFAASLAWRPDGTPADFALRSFVASLALHDALTAIGVADVALKWPNDVLLKGDKLAGILLESPTPGLLILGVGVNLIAAPDVHDVEAGALRPISLLDGAGIRVTPSAMLDTFASAFAIREAQMQQDGFAPIRSAWLAQAAGIGRAITVKLPSETLQGTFDDVDPLGHLVLGTSSGQRTIPAGDVFFGTAA